MSPTPKKFFGIGKEQVKITGVFVMATPIFYLMDFRGESGMSWHNLRLAITMFYGYYGLAELVAPSERGNKMSAFVLWLLGGGFITLFGMELTND